MKEDGQRIFTPEKAEHVLAISYETQMPNTTISYEVYLLDKDAKAPDDGVLIESGKSTRRYGGFYQ